MRPMLGTFVEVGVIAGLHAHDAAFRAIELVERSLSFQDPASELSCLNRSAAEFVALSPPALRVLRLARAMTAASDGLFNCTVGGSLVRAGALPDHGGPEPLDAGTAEDILIERGRACIARPLRITLDGIAKGYAVDCAIRALQRAGARAGWVNAGGDLRVFGALTLPVWVRGADGRPRLAGGLRHAAMATSMTGAPADPSFPGRIVHPGARPPRPGVWTVLARHAWRADALTKVAALAPEALRAALLTRLGGRLVAAS
jgi:thiamine biosynthesis lipoprotein